MRLEAGQGIGKRPFTNIKETKQRSCPSEEDDAASAADAELPELSGMLGLWSSATTTLRFHFPIVQRSIFQTLVDQPETTFKSESLTAVCGSPRVRVLEPERVRGQGAGRGRAASFRRGELSLLLNVVMTGAGRWWMLGVVSVSERDACRFSDCVALSGIGSVPCGISFCAGDRPCMLIGPGPKASPVQKLSSISATNAESYELKGHTAATSSSRLAVRRMLLGRAHSERPAATTEARQPRTAVLPIHI